MIHNISRFIAALALLATAQGAWAQWTGSGTSDDPYIIANATDLNKIYTMVNTSGTTYENVYFKQTEDIDCSTVEGTSTYGAGIGRDASHPFKGRYDGGGKKIKNLRITATDSQYAGLFGYIVGGAYQGNEANTHVAEVHRVVLDNPTITITATSSEQFAGAIVGYAGDCSQIYDNTVIGGSVTYTGGSNYNTNNSYVGGIVGNYGYGSNLQRLTSNTVVGTTLSGAGISGGLVGLLAIYGRFSGNFADASISGTDFRAAGVKREGALVGSYNHYSGSVTDVNYYHSASGLTAYGDYYTNYGSSYSMSPVADNEWVAPLYTVGGLPDGATVSGTATVTYDGTGYYAEGAVLTIGTGSDDKVFSDFTATGATAGSLVADRRSATVTVGTADVTVSATLQTVSGTTDDGLTWSLAQDNSGNYTRLTVGGNGAMQNYSHTTDGTTTTRRTTAPWGYGLTSVTIGNGVTAIGSYAFIGCQSLAAATIGSSVATIGQQAFDHCDALVTVTLPASVTALGQGAFYNCIGLQRIDILHDGAVSLAANVFYNDNALQYIVFSSIAAEQANTTGNWSAYAAKLRAKFGNQHFAVTTEGGTPAYQIATADDLRHLAAAVNATDNISTGKTFRQTADIDLASGGNFKPIGSQGGSNSFAGTYDGGGHTISGLTVSKDHDSIGLFGTVRGATVRNVILLSPTAKATTTNSRSVYLGALIGMCSGTSSILVENCHVVNPTVSSSSTHISNYVGAIIGNIYETNTTATNCYYYGGNANAACGQIEGGATVTNVCAAHRVTPADGVTIQTPMAADLGFSCDADNNGTAENYWRTGAQLTLGYTGTVPEGYTIGYTATNGGTISGSTLTMPDADLAVAMSPQAIPWSGSGTASDPYVIEYPSQLLLLAHRVNGTNGETANTYQGKYFKLGADITFTHPENETEEYAENYEAIGGDIGGYDRFFEGDFDGDGYTVSGIRIRKDGSGNADYYQGLFGRIASGANIHDVHLTDARITGYKNVGGIAGYNTGEGGYISGCSVTDSYITATRNSNYGTICGYTTNTDRLSNNYYHGCTVNGTENATNVGCGGSDIADLTANNGALPAYRLDLGANITPPPGTFAGQTEWLDTPPVSPRLDPENGFTLAGNHYFASGYVFTPGSTLASGAAQGYTPRATLGGQLLDLYTPTGDADPLAGKAIAQFTVTADCDGKTLASTQAIYSTGQPVTVAYIKADGTPGEASAIALDGTETTLAAGTYYVGTDITYANPIWPDGDVTLILADGKTMTLNGNTMGIAGGRNLTIYGQSLDDATAGTLRYNGKSDGINADNYVQHSGNVSITTTGSFVFGIDADVTLRGGTLTVTANGDKARAISGNTQSILGGHLTATATGAGATGISAGASNGNITLGWTRPTDRIYASSYSGTVAVADGKKLHNGSDYLGGTLGDPAADVNGKTLRPAATATYTTADGTADTADAIILDASDNSLPAGNYLATGTLNYTHGITLAGDVTLILADNCHMNVGTSGERISDYGIFGFSGGSHSITITSQSLGDDMGALSVYTTGMNKFGILANAITIDGGNVTADTDGRAAVALYAGGTDLTINGGTVTATTAGTDAHAIYAIGDFKYNGGDVTATATAANANAIYAYGNYNFSWRTPADRITIGATGLYAPDDDKTATFARLFTDASGNIYTGTLTHEAVDALAGKHLYPYIATLDLAARQAPDENYWTTFYCGHTDYQIDANENACAYTATYGAGQLTLHRLGKAVPKATAVIIVADNGVVSMTAATVLPAFSGTNDLRGVNVDTPVANITSDLGEGTLYVLGMTTVNNEQHFGFHRYTGEEMAARKAFLHVPGSSNARALDMVFANEETGITTTNCTNNTNSDDAWYTLDGRKLNGKPTKPGLYINNGRKVVIK